MSIKDLNARLPKECRIKIEDREHMMMGIECIFTGRKSDQQTLFWQLENFIDALEQNGYEITKKEII